MPPKMTPSSRGRPRQRSNLGSPQPDKISSNGYQAVPRPSPYSYYHHRVPHAPPGYAPYFLPTGNIPGPCPAKCYPRQFPPPPPPTPKAPSKNHSNAILREFMSYIHDRKVSYPENHKFTYEELVKVTPTDVCRWINEMAFGDPDPDPDDTLLVGDIQSILSYKNVIYSYLPHSATKWDPATKMGNPIKSDEVLELIAKLKKLGSEEKKESGAKRKMDSSSDANDDNVDNVDNDETDSLDSHGGQGTESIQRPQKTHKVATTSDANNVTDEEERVTPVAVVPLFYLSFKSDLIHFNFHQYQKGKGGILHAFRQTVRRAVISDEHSFAWVQNTEHIETAVQYLQQLGFDRKFINFLPFSSKKKWIEQYPHAFPCVECLEDGQIRTLDSTAYDERKKTAGKKDNITTPEKKKTAGKKDDTTTSEKTQKAMEDKLLKHCVLPNEERLELHVEIYKYFKWLQDELTAMEAKPRKTRKRPLRIRRAGITVSGIQSILDGLQASVPALKRIKDVQLEKNEKNDKGSPRMDMPLLETGLENDLRQRVKESPTELISHFDLMFARLMKYKEIHGNLNVKESENDRELVNWISRLKQRKNELAKQGKKFDPENKSIHGGTLTIGRIERLESIGFKWAVAAPPQEDFDDFFRELELYKEQHGHMDFKKNYTQNGFNLWNWTNKLRVKKYKMERKGTDPGNRTSSQITLTKERIERLEALGFPWVKSKKRPWIEHFNELVEFYRLHGHFNVPRDYFVGVYNMNLGFWVQLQKKFYVKKDPKFMKERFHKLNELVELGWKWQTHENKNFEAYLEQLVKYKEEYGDTNVPSRYDPNPKLARWVKTVRQQRKLLWEKGLDCAPERDSKNKDNNEETLDNENFGNQNEKRAMTYLTRDRVNALDEVGFLWDLCDNQVEMNQSNLDW